MRRAAQFRQQRHHIKTSSGSSKPSAATQETSGAGPSIAERSKDAKAARAGRQPGAYVKD
jgi:hypothetical protein